LEPAFLPHVATTRPRFRPTTLQGARSQPPAHPALHADGHLLPGDEEDQWLVVTSSGLAICTNGQARELIRHLPIEKATSFRAHSVVGSGFLQARVDGLWVDLLRYSNSLSDRFVKVARKLEQLRTQRPIEILPTDNVDQRRCPTSAAPLVGDVCPQCIDRKAVLSRVCIWSAAPRRWECALPILGVLAELPPIAISVDRLARIITMGGLRTVATLLVIVLFLAVTRVVARLVTKGGSQSSARPWPPNSARKWSKSCTTFPSAFMTATRSAC
jgi:hypothetical protein